MREDKTCKVTNLNCPYALHCTDCDVMNSVVRSAKHSMRLFPKQENDAPEHIQKYMQYTEVMYGK